jgi:asparagine synthase (glutamine-hydrolysing)
MCGIAGYFLKDPPTDPGLLAAMTRTLTHRGPDGEGFFTEGGAGLGHRRLAILDVEGGAQPMANEDGTVVVVFNGEIYNFAELRADLLRKGHRFATRSDTEVLVHLYEEEGDAFPAKLNGIFAFALYDRVRRRALLARDPSGVKPLYYAPCPGGLLFGSELKALLAHPGFSRALDFEALASFLVCEYVPTPRSIYAAARKLPPGHRLVSEDSRWEVSPYWDWRLPADVPDRFEDAVEDLRSKVQRSVEGQLISDVPLGVFLSGGVDSSVVAAAMRRAGGRVESFSIGFEDPSFDESLAARAVAEHLGCDHFAHAFSERELLEDVPRVLEHLDEPFADPSIFPTALLSRFARERVTVALGGDGGDELFAGYPTYWVHRRYGAYGAVPGFLRRTALGAADALLPVSHANLTLPYKLRKFRDGAEEAMPLRHFLWMGAWRPEGLRRLLPGLSPVMPGFPEWAPAPPAGDPVTTAQWLDVHTYLLEDILAKVDRASMMASLEARVPLLDPDIVRTAFSVPPAWRLRGRRGKVLLKEAFARDLPPGHLDRPKKGFGIPIARWLAGPLRPMADELLSDGVLGKVPFMDPAEPRRLWREHLAMKADHRKPLWSLLCFLHWWQRGLACA